MFEATLHAGPVARWAMWRLPHRLLGLVLTIECVAIAAVVAGALRAAVSGPTRRDLLLVGCLIVLSVVHVEVATGIERIRRRVADTSYFDLSSVWTFAAAVMLPDVLPAVVILAVYLHLWLRVWKPTRMPAYRLIYTTATVLLAAYAAQVVGYLGGGVQGWPADAYGLAALGVAVFVYAVVNTVLVAAAIALTGAHSRPSELLGHWDDNALEIATLCLGALTAVVLTANPWLVVLVLPPLLVLHRAVLVRQLEEAVRTDGKTGLLTAAAWHALAARELRRSDRTGSPAGVLVLDIDHFKKVNDDEGHLVGDVVLATVAARLRKAAGLQETLVRWGGEEFVVLAGDLDAAGLAELGERLRAAVALSPFAVGASQALTVTVSAGGALGAIGKLRDTVQAADSALYEAKRAGRNRVALAAES